jgi:tRNA-specific 2-thiouridylase
VKVLIAMSGGVDSSVAAALVADAGHEVAGVTLKLWGGDSDTGCCSVADVEDARRVAAQLGIDHHVLNLTEEFDHFVVDPYVAAHASGSTPNPCVECNRHLKFGTLFDVADRLGYDAVATGHHARIEDVDGHHSLVRGVDSAKDQSYVVGMLQAKQLERVLFPVGVMTKTQVRQIASDRGLRTALKAESQDVCFIERSKGRRNFLSTRLTLTPASVVDQGSGAVVGSIDALELITVGQRQGLGVDAEGKRRVAVSIDRNRPAVIVTDADSAKIRTVDLDETTWTAASESFEANGSHVRVQLRSHAASVAGSVFRTHIELDESIDPIARGQLCVVFDSSDSTVLASVVVA